MKFLDKLERKFGKLAIHNLMGYIVFSNAAVYILAYFQSDFLSYIYLSPYSVLHGEVWRLVTFLFIPPMTSILFIILALYFEYMIGISLEHEWGAFKFNIYYFVGVIGTIIASFITGLPMSNGYLNLSLFFAFAKLFPEFELLIFFILPVKIKYLGWISWIMLIISFILGSMSTRVAIVVAILNYILFFGKDSIMSKKHATNAHIRKREYKSKMSNKKPHMHQCEVCGKTELDDVNLEFRYCSKCDGRHEYCMEHLFTHEHIKDNDH